MSTTTTLTANEVFQGDTCVAFTIPSNLKGAKAWNYAKNEVHSRWSGVISTIFATGDLLREMKNRSDDEIEGTWEKWVKANLPFSNRTDQRLRAIAAFKPFRSEEVKSVLPAYWGNLDVLRSQAMVNPNRFQELLSEEKITPSISRNEIKGFFVKKSENSGSANRNDEDADEALEALIELSKSGTQYGCLYVDPPWASGNGGGDAGGIPIPYKSLSQTKLIAMGETIKALTPQSAQLHLWATSQEVGNAIRLMEAWGFNYRSQLVWTKPNEDRIGLGHYWANSHEILLTGIKGASCPFSKTSGKIPPSVYHYASAKHSKKPDAIRNLVEQVSPSSRLELFARNACAGWTCWGNEIDGFVSHGVELEKLDKVA